MKEEMERGWLRLADKSDLVLTNLHVFHYRNSGAFGEIKTVIPLQAITTARISWRRSRVLLAAGILLLMLFLALWVGSLAANSAEMPSFYRAELFSSSAMSLVRYGALLGAIAVLVLCYFYKRNEIQIIAPTGTIGGISKSYEDARKFCDLLFSETKDPSPSDREEKGPGEKQESTEPEWHL